MPYCRALSGRGAASRHVPTRRTRGRATVRLPAVPHRPRRSLPEHPPVGQGAGGCVLPARQEYFILDSQMAEEAHTWSPSGFQPVTSARCEEKASAPFRGCRAGGEGQDRLRKPRRSCVLESAHQGGNCLPVYYTRNV